MPSRVVSEPYLSHCYAPPYTFTASASRRSRRRHAVLRPLAAVTRSKPSKNTVPYADFGWPYAAYFAAIPGAEADTTPCHNRHARTSSHTIRHNPTMKTTLTPPPLPTPIPADIHTHRHDIHDGSAVVNITLEAAPPIPPTLFSAGIHPWKADKATEDIWSWLEGVLKRPNAYAVGEAGLDLRHGPSIDVQLPVFRRQAFMADDLAKPLIIHLVGAYDRLYKIQKEVMQRNGGHTPLWIIHGFRGRPELACQLLDHGMYLSMGARFNPETVGIVPPHRLLAETDDNPTADIADIRRDLGL